MPTSLGRREYILSDCYTHDTTEDPYMQEPLVNTKFYKFFRVTLKPIGIKTPSDNRKRKGKIQTQIKQ